MTQQRDPRNTLRIPVAEVQNLFPYIDWLTYINELFAPHKTLEPYDAILVSGVNYFKLLGDVIQKTPKRVIANYMGWRMLWQSVNSLSQKFVDIHDKLDRALTGSRAKHPRWHVCVKQTKTNFPLGMGALYVRRYFDESKKTKAEGIIRDMYLTFKDILEQVS